MGSGATFSYAFTTPGTFTYVCGIHPFMHGTVVVR
ncbi:plastocyanin/azurin family copper-binding protein [Mycobacterium kansasii]